jgi:hypothetical protein
MRLTSEQGSSKVRNLYAFKERIEGGDEDDDFDLSDDDDDDDIPMKGRGKMDDGTKTKSRRE